MTKGVEVIKGPDVETLQKQTERWMEKRWPRKEIEKYRGGELLRVDNTIEITIIEQESGAIEVSAPVRGDIFRDLTDHLSGGTRAQEQGAATFEEREHKIKDPEGHAERTKGKTPEELGEEQEDTVVKPFSWDEAEYVEPGDEGYDKSHGKCRDCAHYDGHGNCMIVPNITPSGYCNQLFADAGFFGHEDMGMVEVNLVIFGEDFDWETENAEDFLDEIAENLSDRVE